MESQKQKTCLIIQLQLDEKLVERVLIIFISAFLSFTGGAFYTSFNNIQEPNLTTESTKLIPSKN